MAHKPVTVLHPHHPQPKNLVLLAVILLCAWIGLLTWQTIVHFPWRLQIFSLLFFWRGLGSFNSQVFLLHWISTLGNVFLFFMLMISAHGLGRWCYQKLLKSSLHSHFESLLYSLGLGLILLMAGIFIMGIFKLYHPGIAMSFLAITTAGGAWVTWQNRRELYFQSKWLLGQPTWPDRILFGLLLAYGVLILLFLNTPELFFDSLVYHLAVPNQWIIAGHIHKLPYNFFSNFPMNLELLYTAALLLGDERLCRMLHTGLGLLSGGMIFALGRRWFNRRVGFWAAGLFLTIPLLILNMLTSGVDAGSVFFGLLALGLLLEWLLVQPAGSLRELLVAGLFTGAALGCKYNLIFLLGPAVIVIAVAAYFKQRRWKTLGQGACLFSLGALLLLSPWMVKNILYTGNPVYPFAYQYFSSPEIHPEKMKQQMDGFREFGTRNWWQFLRQPWDLTFYLATSNSYVGVVFLFLLPGILWLAVQWRHAPPLIRLLLLILFLAALLWSSQTQIARYFLPAFPVLILLSAYVLDRWEKWQAWIGGLSRWAILGFIAWGWFVTTSIGLQNWDPVGVAIGWESRDHYLERKLMNSYYVLAKIVNKLPPESKILSVGETRSYYFQRPVTATTVYDYQPWVEHLAQANQAEEVWQWLQKAGYTHVFIHPEEAARTRGYEPYQWTPAACERLQELLSYYLKPVHHYGQQVLYRVLSEPQPQKPLKRGRPLYTYDKNIIDKVIQNQLRLGAFLQARRYLDAEAILMRMQALTPEWEIPYIILAWLYEQTQRFNEAFALYLKADNLAYLEPYVYNNMGVYCIQRGERDKAQYYFQLALEEAPELDTARKNLEILQKK